MNIKIYCTLFVLEYLGKTTSYPTSINGFYQALHDRLGPVRNTGNDACQIIADKKVVSYEEAINCYSSFPLIESVRYYTLDTLKKTLESYIFGDILTKSPDEHFPSSKDIFAELKEIDGFKFGSEFEFNSFLSGYLNTFNDGHTRYVSNCYSTFKFRQPFPIYILGSEVRVLERIFHSEELMKKWSKLGIDVTKYQGALVLKINNMDPIEYFTKYSQFYIGVFRDINSQLNYGFSRVVLEGGDWGISNGLFSNTTLVPLYSSISYSLETSDGKTHDIDVPYLVESPEGFNDKKSYYTKYCKSNGIEQDDGNMLSNIVTEFIAPISQPLIKPKRSKRDLTLESKLEGPGLLSYKVNNNTGVLVISDFITGKHEEWEDSILEIFNSFRDSKIDNLILSLSNNPGGYIYRCIRFLNTLFEDTKLFPMDQKSSYIQKILSKADFLQRRKMVNLFNLEAYKKVNGGSFHHRDGINKLEHYSRGSRKNVSFTPKYIYPFSKYGITDSFKPKNIAIVSNGLCYSACGFLVKSLQQIHKIPTYLYGGDVSLPAQPASGLGGLMVFDTLFSLIDYALKDEEIPYFHPLPKHVRFSFSHDEAYSHLHKDRPLEFVYLPADYHLPNDRKSMAHPAYLWGYIAKEMNDPDSEFHLGPVKIN